MIIAATFLLVSGVGPQDRLTWFLEVLPVMIAAVVLVSSRAKFPLTPLAYRLIFLHAAILMLGGHYTYAEVPVGFWLQNWLDLSRNPYDRLGHFAQGFVPAMLTREILLRTTPLRPGKMLFFLIVSVSLAISAFYELIEWWVAVASGEAADAFLGTQGDVWDTQWDMFLALIGAITAQLGLAKVHDCALRRHGFVDAH